MASASGRRSSCRSRKRVAQATAERRRSLNVDLDNITDALDATRDQRVAAALGGSDDDPPTPAPPRPHPTGRPAGQAAWRDLAYRLETVLDDPVHASGLHWSHQPHDRLAADLLNGTSGAIERARSVIAAAGNPSRTTHAHPIGPHHHLQPTTPNPGPDLGL